MSTNTTAKTRKTTGHGTDTGQNQARERTALCGPCVYCGPSVPGVVRQYTVYTGEIPDALKTFIGEHPAVRGLIVPVERFAQTRKRMETAGTAEAILYQTIKSEL